VSAGYLRAEMRPLSIVAAILVAATLVAPSLFPAVAVADGDPASDVLLGENVFYPFTPAVSDRLQAELSAETTAASLAHFPIKVALIASPADLGAISSLFGKPQEYANFLDREISSGSNKQPLLVVMRSGFGAQGLDLAAAMAVVRLATPAGPSTDALAQAAVLAIPKLAAAAGHPIGAVRAGSTPAGGSSRLLSLTLLAVAAVAVSGVIIEVRRRRAGIARRRRPRTPGGLRR
jgi:hypothetical protein